MPRAATGSVGSRHHRMARRAAAESAEQAIAPAGALPDPQLVAGVDNLPVNGSDPFSLTHDFMTFWVFGAGGDEK